MDFLSAKGDFDVTVDSKLMSKLKKTGRTGGSSSSTDVFSLRYGFRPDSLEASSKLNLSRDKEDFVIEDTGPENHVFRGQATGGKDVDCVLIFDTKSQSFKLHQLDFTLRINPSREKLKKNPSNGLVLPSSSSSQDTPSPTAFSPGGDAISPPVGKAGSGSGSSSDSRSGSPAPNISPEESSSHSSTVKASSPKKQEPLGIPIESPVTSPPSLVVPPPKRKPGRPVTGKKSVPSTSSKPKRVPRTASKSLPRNVEPIESIIVDDDVAMRNADDEDDDDDDLLGALANELEESLEDDSNSVVKEPISNVNNDSEESDEDDGHVNRVTIIERNPQPSVKLVSSPALNSGPPSGGPISLRGFVSGRRAEEDDLSSSEEE